MFKKVRKNVNVGSLIEVMERYVEYGLVFGYDFTWCKDDIVNLIERSGEKYGFKWIFFR